MSSLGECSVNCAISTAVATQTLGPSPQGYVLSLLLFPTSAETQSQEARAVRLPCSVLCPPLPQGCLAHSKSLVCRVKHRNRGRTHNPTGENLLRLAGAAWRSPARHYVRVMETAASAIKQLGIRERESKDNPVKQWNKDMGCG